MTVKKIYVRTADRAFQTLEQLSKDGYACFRGHRDAKWRLESTLARHRKIPPNPRTTHEIDEMIDHFIVNLASIGIPLPFDKQDRRGRLEFARHYGVPSPLIDFSFSPYVALFFAFNGVRPSEAKKGDYVAIYCLNIFELASVWARQCARHFDGSVSAPEFNNHLGRFLYNREEPFVNGYEIGILKYFDMPASWNRRMQRQHGRFLYDTLNYPLAGYSDLEAYLGQPEVPGPHEKVMLLKVLIPQKVGREIFERLELMGITATHLYDSQEGAALDVINAYNYGRRTGRAWDVNLPPGDD
jgi:hypothetical protein